MLGKDRLTYSSLAPGALGLSGSASTRFERVPSRPDLARSYPFNFTLEQRQRNDFCACRFFLHLANTHRLTVPFRAFAGVAIYEFDKRLDVIGSNSKLDSFIVGHLQHLSSVN